ncbi:MAG: hypothetical protein CM15mV28_1780 [Thaumasvirus sp.]|nr:MAG: hypothetical protein CM15mV28_1780 [Thaumasvirus sp.]
MQTPQDTFGTEYEEEEPKEREYAKDRMEYFKEFHRVICTSCGRKR